MSLSKQQEMDRQIEKNDFPEITELNMLAMLETNYSQISAYAEQMIKEVYEWVRPRVHHDRSAYWAKYEYKTNIKSDAVGLGEKIIIGWSVERGYSARTDKPWRISYQKENNFTQLDNAFSLLADKGICKTYHGPLFDAVANASHDGAFETEYFKGRMYSNRNMHLQFKRIDLLAEFNRVAAGGKIRNGG